MHLTPFQLHRPESLDQALDLLSQHEDEAQVYMGGTELLMLMKLGLAAPEHLIDCKRLPELTQLKLEDSGWRIGAGVTHRRMELDRDVNDKLPAMARLQRSLANVRVRNVGTLGGNLCFAEPHSDPATLLVALGATVELVSANGTRTVNLADFILGPLLTVREPDELMVSINLPAVGADTNVAWQRLAFRERPVANVAYVRRGSDHRLVAGAVGGRPVRLENAEALLTQGGSDDPEAIAAAARDEVEPFDDLDGGTDYKRHLVGVLVRDAIRSVREGASHGRDR